jgi:hypothetical protein
MENGVNQVPVASQRFPHQLIAEGQNSDCLDQRSVEDLKMGHEPLSTLFLFCIFHRMLTGGELSLEDKHKSGRTPRTLGDEGLE